MLILNNNVYSSQNTIISHDITCIFFKTIFLLFAAVNERDLSSSLLLCRYYNNKQYVKAKTDKSKRRRHELHQFERNAYNLEKRSAIGNADKK